MGQEADSSNNNSTTISPRKNRYSLPSSIDVWQDVQTLENAIQLSKADDQRASADRVAMMEAMARQRRPLHQTVRQHYLRPLLGSLIVAILCKLLHQQTACSSTTTLWRAKSARVLLEGLSRVSVTHFWSVVVASPLLLWVALKVARRRVDPALDDEAVPFELSGAVESQSSPFNANRRKASSSSSSSSSCCDFVLCLTEQWCSAVVGMAVLATATPLLPNQAMAQLGQACGRILTRLAAWASLRQFPKLWFQLEHSRNTQRPLTLGTWALTGLTQSMWLPWLVAWDVAELLVVQCQSSWRTILGVHLPLLVAGCTVLALRQPPPAVASPQSRQQSGVRVKKTNLKILATLLQILVVLGSLSWSMRRFVVVPLRHFSSPTGKTARRLPLVPFTRLVAWMKPLLAPAAIGVAILGPVCHLVALARLYRVAFTHDLPLTLNRDAFGKAKDDRQQWRHWLRWREPQRISTALGDLLGRSFLQLLIGGSVDAKLEQAEELQRHEELVRSNQHILRRMEEQLQWQKLHQQGGDASVSNHRDEWKTRAMKRVAKEHERNHQLKNYDNDPIGIGVQQVFGVGLGLGFGPNDGSKLRQLQLDAAKSAIARAQEIHLAKKRYNLQPVGTQPTQSSNTTKATTTDTDAELDELGRKLTELVPTDMSLSEEINEYGLPRGDQQRNIVIDAEGIPKLLGDDGTQSAWGPIRSQSPSIENLYKLLNNGADDVDYLNPSGTRNGSYRTFTTGDIEGGRDPHGDPAQEEDDWEPIILDS